MEAIITFNGKAFSESIVDIVKEFQKIGWGILNPQGMVEYLPVGDNERYNWKEENIEESKLYDILLTKMARKEPVGINLFYHGGTEGISMIADNTEEIILGLSINRKIINDNHTDTAWYLENIIYKLLDNGVRLLAYKVEEQED